MRRQPFYSSTEAQQNVLKVAREAYVLANQFNSCFTLQIISGVLKVSRSKCKESTNHKLKRIAIIRSKE